MRIILLTMLLAGCITYPSSIRTYECSDEQKKRLPRTTAGCINSALFNSEYRDHDATIDKCYSIALRTVCAPKDSFILKTFPFGGDSTPIPCIEAQSYAEHFVCDN